jgi:hypothetical protein
MSTFTLSQARQAIMTVIQQAQLDHSAYDLKVETANRDVVDQAAQTDPYLQITVAPMGGEQAELGENPNVRHDGQILISAVVKDGAGTAGAEDLLAFILPYLSCKSFGPLQCYAAVEVQGYAKRGLWYQPAIVPYHYFSRSV